MTRTQIDNVINMLAYSQGFYGRLRRDLNEATEEDRERFYSQYEHCKGNIDFIMELEG